MNKLSKMAKNQPNLNREMFYDRLVKNVNDWCNNAEKVGMSENCRLKKLPKTLDDAKVFYIDDLIKDSLLNSKFNFIDKDPELGKLPFPYMFFEFETGLEYRTLKNKIDDENFINGLLFTPLRKDLAAMGESELLFKQDRNLEGFSVYTFGNSRKYAMPGGPIHEAHFFKNYEVLIVGELVSKKGEGLVNAVCHNVPIPLSDRRREEFLRKIPKDELGKYEGYYEFIEDEYLDAKKMPNLVINLIDYIRAENVIVTPKTRILRGFGKGQTPKQAKPYHLVEVKKRIYPKAEDAQEGLWEIEYRFWVMGHNHKYWTNKGLVTNWLDAYIKGPVNAPWLNRRYMMLYKNFRHRLDRRGDEDIGTSLEDKIK